MIYSAFRLYFHLSHTPTTFTKIKQKHRKKNEVCNYKNILENVIASMQPF